MTLLRIKTQPNSDTTMQDGGCLNILSIDSSTTTHCAVACTRIRIEVDAKEKFCCDKYDDICDAIFLEKKKSAETTKVVRYSLNILNLIKNVIDECEITLDDIHLIAVSNGPAKSFTGIRLSSSIAQSISFVQNVPVAKISTLQVLAQTAAKEACTNGKSNFDFILVGLKVRTGRNYLGVYKHCCDGFVRPIFNDKIVPFEKIFTYISHEILNSKYCLVGDAWGDISEHEKLKLLYRDKASKMPAVCLPDYHADVSNVAKFGFYKWLFSDDLVYAEGAVPNYVDDEF